MSISVPNNILWSEADFDAFELNIIVMLLVNLRQYIYLAGSAPDPGEFYLRFSSFTGRHCKREDIVTRMNALRKKDIRYRYATPGGISGQVITGLFSSVTITAGGVYARVSAEAVPWLLYIGQGVGYSRLEPELFLSLTSVYQKRLYLTLLAREYQGLADVRVQVERLCEVLGLPEGTPASEVRRRYLDGLAVIMKQRGSMYNLSYRARLAKKAMVGHPTIAGFEIVFSVKPEYLATIKEIDKKAHFECLELLRSLMPYLSKKNSHVMSYFTIHNLLVEKNLSNLFLKAMSAYAGRTQENQANIVPLILKDRFGIDVFSSSDDG